MVDRDDMRSKLEPLVLAGEYAEAQKIIGDVFSMEESPALQAEAKLDVSRILIVKGEWDKPAGVTHPLRLTPSSPSLPPVAQPSSPPRRLLHAFAYLLHMRIALGFPAAKLLWGHHTSALEALHAPVVACRG